MPLPYNRISGTSVERIAALSDGIFAVVMTLLVLDLHVPARDAIQGERELWEALVGLAPHILVYLLSFLTLGIFWVGQQTQLNQLARADRDMAWMSLGFLFIVVMMPFSTEVVAEFPAYRVALLVYWANILLLGCGIALCWRHAFTADLVRPDAPAGLCGAVLSRVLIAQLLYAFGAALCVFSTYWSLGFIILVQLNYVFAPRIGVLRRI
jgi:uncharacterized membrane protein